MCNNLTITAQKCISALSFLQLAEKKVREYESSPLGDCQKPVCSSNCDNFLSSGNSFQSTRNLLKLNLGFQPERILA